MGGPGGTVSMEISAELQAMIDRHPVVAVDRVWEEAIAQTLRLGATRHFDVDDRNRKAPVMPGGPGGPPGVERGPAMHEIADSPADRLKRMRDKLAGELVAFHEHLHVAPYTGERTCAPGRKLWQIGVPLTLFPKRDQGFSRLECLIELSSPAGPGTFRVVELQPAARAEVFGKLELGGKLDVETSAKLGVRIALPPSASFVSDAVGQLYGRAHADFAHELRRDCVVSEIVEGTGGRWRLDDVSRPHLVAPEGHQLALVVEAAPDALPLHLTGFLQAYSDVHWLMSSLDSLWSSLRDQLAAWFRRGLPIEAYGEWRDILPRGPW